MTAAAVKLLPCFGTAQEAGSRKQEAGGSKQEARNGNRVAIESAICNPQVAICTGLSLGLAPIFWSQALITEVYALAAFFTALVVVFALRGGPGWALGLAWCVGMGSHPTLLFLAPLVAWRAWGNRGGRLRRLAQAGLLVLLGWGAMYGPVLLARGGTPSAWGDVSTLGGWWALVSGQLYRGYVFGLPLTAWPQRLLAWMGLMARQFTPFGVALAGLGWLHLWRELRPLAAASALAFGAFSLYAIGYNTADSLVYLVRTMRDYYNIPNRNIIGHGQVPGAKTECPGTRFPWKTFRKC